ncbi:MAG: ATP-binding cassette domain-containing protein [Ardenticatenia bacterium]|nr:ATP-binding cassette domain-containing protein [Ardenticatenia bacterium]
MNARELVIEVRGLAYTHLRHTPFAAQALKEVNLEVWRGEAVAILGPTGSGKSTLVQHLNGLLRPQEGRVRVLGFDLNDPRVDVRALRRRVGSRLPVSGEPPVRTLRGRRRGLWPSPIGVQPGRGARSGARGHGGRGPAL